MKWVRRILGGILALVALCVAGLWLAGLRPGQGYCAATVEINRRPAQVWRYLTTDELTKKWVSGLEVIRHDSPGVHGSGEKLHMVESYEGERVEMEMTMGRVEAPRVMEFTLVALGDPSNGFTEKGGYALEERDGKTRVTLAATSEYHGFLLRLMEPLITRSAKEKLRGDLARLKALVEAEHDQAGATPSAETK